MLWISLTSAFILLLWLVLSRTRPRTAICTLPIAAFISLIVGALFMDEYDEEIFFIIAIIWAVCNVLLTLLSLASLPYDQITGQSPWPRLWAKRILIVLGYAALLGFLLAFLNVPGLLLFCILAVSLFRSRRTSHYAGVTEILSTLSHCVRRGLPLPMALNTAAENSSSPRTARIMRSISHWLVMGLPLSEAIRNGWSRVPGEIVTSIEAAEKIAQLPQVLDSLELDTSEKTEEFRRVEPVNPVYPVVVGTVAFLIMMGLFVFILPTFVEVLSDISEGQQQLPKATQFLLNITGFLTNERGLPALLIIAFLLLAGQLAGLLSRKNRRPGSILTSIIDRLKWHLPVQGWFERNYTQLRLVEYLRAALRTGKPVNDALRDALILDLNGCFKTRMLRWIQQIENGRPFAEAARKAGMGKTLSWAFEEGLNRQNLPELLSMIEETTRQNYDFRIYLLRSILWPFIILGLGATVGFFVYAFFIPMVQMIYVTMEYSMP